MSLLISQTTDQFFPLVIHPKNYLPNSKLTTWRWQLANELMIVTTPRVNMSLLTGDVELNSLNFNCKWNISEIGSPVCLLLFSFFKTVFLYSSLALLSLNRVCVHFEDSNSLIYSWSICAKNLRLRYKKKNNKHHPLLRVGPNSRGKDRPNHRRKRRDESDICNPLRINSTLFFWRPRFVCLRK